MKSIFSFLKKIGLLHLDMDSYNNTDLKLNSNTLTKKTLIFIVVILVILIFVVFSRRDKRKTTAHNIRNNVSVCKVTQLSKKADNRVTAKIVLASNVGVDKTQKTYSLTELDNLAFGYKAKKTSNGYYIAKEICKGDVSITGDKLSAENWNFIKEDSPGAISSFAGSYENFASDQKDGTKFRSISKPGKYTLFLYTTTDGKKWYVAAQHNFEVTK